MALTGNEVLYLAGIQPNGQPSGVTEAVTAQQLVNFASSVVSTGALTATSNTTLATVPGLVTNLVAGATYIFYAYLSVSANASGGIKVNLGNGTATATSFLADTWVYNTTTVQSQGNVSSLATAEVAATEAATCVEISGTFVCLASGTFIVQAAQNASYATATTVNAGSYLQIERVS